MTDLNFDIQIQRIKDKLLQAQQLDKDLDVFGADSHEYIIHLPALENKVKNFEEQYDITLPSCYRNFILRVGNGGISYNDSAAGPFYGIYPLGENIDDLIYTDTEKYLKNPCKIYPKISDSNWQSLIKNIEENDNISDEDYELELANIYSGILPIGSQGCTYLHGLILNGKYKGRVVNLDTERSKPQFAFENNFLDWYERWLDEVISGDLIKDTPSWFGYCKGGTEENLLDTYINTIDETEKQDCLEGLLNKNKLKDVTISKIIEILEQVESNKKMLIQLICKTNYDKAKPYLLELISTDMLSVFQIIYWYAKEKSEDWYPIIEKNIFKIQDEQTFRFCTYLLSEMKIDYAHLLIIFTEHVQDTIRQQAFYTLGKLPNKKAYLNIFIKGLNDASNIVIHTTLQALSQIKDDSLLPHYKNIAIRFPQETDYILVNLNHRLADYGLNKDSIINTSNL